jgi:4-amino-4-deoxy-L-arabinose transferase-like glycosyltransferase
MIPDTAAPDCASGNPRAATPWQALVAILTVAVFLRFVLIAERSLWFDEAYSASVAARPIGRLLVSIREDTHPPLYYLLLAGWVRAFGTSEAALRSLGAIASTLTVAGTWWLGRRMADPAVGLVAAFIAAVAPLQVLSAQEARMYPLLGLLTLIAWGLLVTALEGRRVAWAGYVAVTVLALYTHYFAFFNIAAQAVFVIATGRRSRQVWLVSQLVILLFYLPWLGTALDTFLSGRGWPFFRPPVGLSTLTSLLGLFSFGGQAFGFDGYFGGGTTALTAQMAVLLPFLGVAGAGIAAHRKSPASLWLVGCYLMIPIAAAFLFSLRHNIFYPRYFSFVFPPFAVMLAMGVHRVAAAFDRSRHRVALGLVLAGFLAFNIPVLTDIYRSPGFQDWRGAARLVGQRAGPDDLIVLVPAFGFLPFTYYFKGPQRVVRMNPREFDDLQAGNAPRDVAAEASTRAKFRSYAARHRVMWIVAALPLPPVALERLSRLLVGIYDVRGLAEFNGVRVWRAVRHRAGEGAP